MKNPLPLSSIEDKELKSIKGVLFDIDDTFSSAGVITKEAYNSLWKLKELGLVLVPVTGRPAGWCDHIVRFWPVDAVVGENGAFVFYMKDGKRSRMDVLGKAEVKENKLKLSDLLKDIVSEFKDVKFASDQNYREYDLAIDICEDVTPWKDSKVKRLIEFIESRSAIAKLSSIHVNAWFGEYNKLDAFKLWVDRGMPGANKIIKSFDEWAYLGDSPNDAPMFSFFNKSIGVNNVKKYLDKIDAPPKWITDGESGVGFSEFVSRLFSI